MSASEQAGFPPAGFTIDQVRAHWDDVIDLYDRANEKIGYGHRQRFVHGIAYFRCGRDARLLNIWSRICEAVPYLRERFGGGRFVHCEVSGRMVEQARRRFPDEDVRRTDLTDLALESESFDAVLSLETLEHCPDPARFVRELYRVLRPGGELVLSCPPALAEPMLRAYELFFENHGEGPHRFCWSRRVKRMLRSAGFELIEHRGTVFLPICPDWLSWLDRLLARALGRTPLGEFGIRQFYYCKKPESVGRALPAAAPASARRAEPALPVDPAGGTACLQVRRAELALPAASRPCHPSSDAYDMLKAEVIDAGLCTRCGSCVGVCPAGVLRIADELGECLPERTGACGDCGGECYLGCPGRYVDFPALNQALHGGPPASYLLGHCRQPWVAHATDPKVRRAGASGGVATAVVKHLFETGRIEGAHVMGMDPARPYLPRPVLARTPEQAQAAAQSKYVVSPHNTLFGRIAPEGGPLAYVGVPCQVHSLRKLQQIGHPVAGRFRYVVGIYCGNILHMSSTRDFLARHGVARLDEVTSLAFRAGEWPGSLRIELRGGRVIQMPKFHANYLIPFHIVRRCLLCADLSNELADLSCGDAWAPVYEQRGEGFSILLARTEAGSELADEMVRQGKLSVTPITFDDAVAMHSHGLDLKKRGAFLRIGRRRVERRAAPEYGFRPARPAALSRRAMETVMGLIFRFCWTSLAGDLMRLVPDRLIGVLFRVARTRWKSATKATKRTGLGRMAFVADPPAARPPGRR